MCRLETVVLLCMICSWLLTTSVHSLTIAQREEVVRVHNWLRASVVPPAANMNKLAYDTAREANLQTSIDNCILQPSSSSNASENLQLSTHDNFTQVIMDWFQERIYWSQSEPDPSKRCRRENAPSGLSIPGDVHCGHYTTMVVGQITQVWCASKFCKTVLQNSDNTKHQDKFINLCQYNVNDSLEPYVVGPACSGCGINMTKCENGLCVENCTSPYCTCEVACKRCTSRSGEDIDSCFCDCGTIGDPDNADCSGGNETTDDLCKACDRSGFSCLNGGVDASVIGSRMCQCQCPAGFRGSRCEISPEISQNMEYGTKVVLNGEQRIGSSVPFPVDSYKFQQLWDSKIRPVFFKAIQDYCVPISKWCIGEYANWTLLEMKNVRIVNRSITLLPTGAMELIVFVQGNPGSKEYMSSSMVSSSLRAATSTITSQLLQLQIGTMTSADPVNSGNHIIWSGWETIGALLVVLVLSLLSF